MRQSILRASILAAVLSALSIGLARADGPSESPGAPPLPSWNDGPAKQTIVDFVHATTDKGSAMFVPPEQRIAVFDNDGTLWVEKPVYTQVQFALARVTALAPQHPE